MSFAGTLTFKNAANLRAALADRGPEPDPGGNRRAVPDAAPAPRPPNASYMVPYTVRAMAELTGSELSGLCAANRRKYRAGIRILGLKRHGSRPSACIPGMQNSWWLYNASVTVDNY